MEENGIDWEQRLWQLTSLIAALHTNYEMRDSEIKEATLDAAKYANLIINTYRGRA